MGRLARKTVYRGVSPQPHLGLGDTQVCRGQGVSPNPRNLAPLVCFFLPFLPTLFFFSPLVSQVYFCTISTPNFLLFTPYKSCSSVFCQYFLFFLNRCFSQFSSFPPLINPPVVFFANISSLFFNRLFWVTFLHRYLPPPPPFYTVIPNVHFPQKIGVTSKVPFFF